MDTILSISSIFAVFVGSLPFLGEGKLNLHQIYDSPATNLPESDFALPQPIPKVDLSESKNVTAVLEQGAILNCRVRGIGNRTVSWIRHRDTHLLTVGRYTYTNDERFRAIHKVKSEDYMLQILPIQKSDEGWFECQISSTPVISHLLYLNIAEPYTEILGGPDIYLEEGFTMNLTCLVKDSPEPPQYIFWYHNEHPISYSSLRGGISQITEKGDVTASFLLIQEARMQDSGEYACHASVGNISSVHVHVFKSQKPEQLVPSSASDPAVAVATAGVSTSYNPFVPVKISLILLVVHWIGVMLFVIHSSAIIVQ